MSFSQDELAAIEAYERNRYMGDAATRKAAVVAKDQNTSPASIKRYEFREFPRANLLAVG